MYQHACNSLSVVYGSLSEMVHGSCLHDMLIFISLQWFSYLKLRCGVFCSSVDVPSKGLTGSEV